MLYEKFGWTLNFWNIAGVPYLYCFQLYYVLKNQSRLDEQQSRRSIAMPSLFIGHCTLRDMRASTE